jgi:hypothetical protein
MPRGLRSRRPASLAYGLRQNGNFGRGFGCEGLNGLKIPPQGRLRFAESRACEATAQAFVNNISALGATALANRATSLATGDLICIGVACRCVAARDKRCA